jgi:hypothetical protein
MPPTPLKTTMQAQPLVLCHSRPEVGGPSDVVADNAKVAAENAMISTVISSTNLLMMDSLVWILKNIIVILILIWLILNKTVLFVPEVAIV